MSFYFFLSYILHALYKSLFSGLQGFFHFLLLLRKAFQFQALFVIFLFNFPVQAAPYFYGYPDYKYQQFYAPFPTAELACKDYIARVAVRYSEQQEFLRIDPGPDPVQVNILSCVYRAMQSGVWGEAVFSAISRGCENGYKWLEKDAICSGPGAGRPPKNMSCPSATAGNPIDFSSGNKFQDEDDYVGSASSPLRFTRYYNSVDGVWRHNYSAHLSVSEGNYVLLTMADGREAVFDYSSGRITNPATEYGALVKLSDGWSYTGTDNERLYFDTSGRLIRMITAEGSEQLISYSGSVVNVTDSYNETLSFSEDLRRHPLSLDVGGVHVEYSYNSNGQLIGLVRVRNGLEDSRTYHYEDPRGGGWLTGITDERGVRYATWSYDDIGRATTSEHAGAAEKVTIEYNSNGSVVVRNSLNRSTIYNFQKINGLNRLRSIEGQSTDNCPYSNSTFTYDGRGFLTKKVDSKGNITVYEFDSRGLEASRTEAWGTPESRTTFTTWHDTFNLPSKVTDGSSVKSYTYNSIGRLINVAESSR